MSLIEERIYEAATDEMILALCNHPATRQLCDASRNGSRIDWCPTCGAISIGNTGVWKRPTRKRSDLIPT